MSISERLVPGGVDGGLSLLDPYLVGDRRRDQQQLDCAGGGRLFEGAEAAGACGKGNAVPSGPFTIDGGGDGNGSDRRAADSRVLSSAANGDGPGGPFSRPVVRFTEFTVPECLALG